MMISIKDRNMADEYNKINIIIIIWSTNREWAYFPNDPFLILLVDGSASRESVIKFINLFRAKLENDIFLMRQHKTYIS